ncbi:MAG: CBS domain-containing protein [Betaproteobacteria bacterium]|nr:CBS domain-containing protein [Betaproteobacteria bacterium]
MKTVAEVLAEKKFGLIHTNPAVSVKNAMSLMVEKNIHCLVVFENEKMCGIISDRDYAHKIVAKGLDPEQVRAQDGSVGFGERLRPIISQTHVTCHQRRVAQISALKARAFACLMGARADGLRNTTSFA